VNRVALSLLAVTACGDNIGGKPKDAHAVPADQSVDQAIAIDAPMLPACANPVSGSTVTLRRISDNSVGGLAVLATAPPNDPRLFVVDVDGYIRIFKDEVLQPNAFIDLSVPAGGPVSAGGEQGLLGLAFHPDYASNGLFFLYYTTGQVSTNNLRDVVARCSVTPSDPDRADPASCVEILSVDDPASNHNGGMIEFGNDGLLYIGIGDGGGHSTVDRAGDPALLFGKILRIDVDHKEPGKEYGIPSDNPYAGGIGGAREVWMMGLRNPWRWSFDRATGDLWIGDVGASAIEELDVLRPSQQKGANLGWWQYEGSSCLNPPCDPTGKTFPKDERTHTAGWRAIVGGQVYRGTCYPDLVGWHFYTDISAGVLIKARLKADDTLEIVDLPGTFPHGLISLHADARGELYASNQFGYVYHLEAGPP